MKNHWNSTIKRKLEMGFYTGEVVLPNDAEELLARVSKDAQVGPLSILRVWNVELYSAMFFFDDRCPAAPQAVQKKTQSRNRTLW